MELGGAPRPRLRYFVCALYIGAAPSSESSSSFCCWAAAGFAAAVCTSSSLESDSAYLAAAFFARFLSLRFLRRRRSSSESDESSLASFFSAKRFSTYLCLKNSFILFMSDFSGMGLFFAFQFFISLAYWFALPLSLMSFSSCSLKTHILIPLTL